MKSISALVFFMGISLLGWGQLYDAQWALGFGESIVDFRTPDTVKIDSIKTLLGFFLTNANICDENGTLLYYTNGVNICSISDTLLNGSLCNCDPSDSIDGLDLPQAALFMPQPGNTRYYYLFHFWNDTDQNTRPGTIYYSLIDKEGNGGAGSVVKKNIPILTGQMLRGGGMTACKHANGRDYWLVMGGSNNNEFYEFLVTPDSILGPYTQFIGPAFPLPYDIAYSKFSQDGSKYATGTYQSLVLIMDFDRCSGEFSNPITLFNNASNDSTQPISGTGGMDFSPNGRFLYESSVLWLNQYDLWAQNIQDSVAIYVADSNDEFQLRFLQLAPNGKLYGCTWDGGLKALHVVNYPDLKGDSANFVYGGQPTYTLNSFNLPNLINYKLGALLGSGCDTIKTDTTGVSITGVNGTNLPRIMPNPADKYAYVEMGMQGNYEFDLLNVAGQIVDKKQTPQVDIFDTEHLASGVYFIRVIDKATGAEIAAGKVVVAH